jgi:hypothetical protein
MADLIADPTAPLTSTQVRANIVRAFRRDLIGPTGLEDRDLAEERLGESPSAWYLTGFLVPSDDSSTTTEAEEEQVEANAGLLDDIGSHEAGLTGTGEGGAEDQPDGTPARRSFMPSSMGLTVMLPIDVNEVEVELTWGDYRPEPMPAEAMFDPNYDGKDEKDGKIVWVRKPRAGHVRLALEPFAGDLSAGGRLPSYVVPESGPLVNRGGALMIDGHWRFYSYKRPDGSNEQVRVLTVTLVNRRHRSRRGLHDASYTFQTNIALNCSAGFHPQRDYADYHSKDDDRRLADLHYRDVEQYGIGRNCAVKWVADGDGKVVKVCTELFPTNEVARVAPNDNILGVEFGMQRLAELARVGAEPLCDVLKGLPAAYGAWITNEEAARQGLASRRLEVANELLAKAENAKNRIADGIAKLSSDPYALQAFEIMNRAIEAAARRREPNVAEWKWRPFQLAFILLNLPGLADKRDPDREIVDLLFFPTGGGKTEAYLGLIAFMIAYRRLTAGGLLGSGVTAIMRYTLRLLTIDQLSRAAGVICALELMREGDEYRGANGQPLLGTWPIEIGLWIGGAGSPNKLKAEKDPEHRTAVKWLEKYKKNPKWGAPAPIEDCPWCRTPLEPDSFRVVPNKLAPQDMELRCVNPDCDFHGGRKLPIVVVDDAIYRRLPALVISTIDKFASLPWEGRTGAFFGHVDRYDGWGFYGADEPNDGQTLPNSMSLDPPDLVIQDELHLISGPLGTVAALYEAAIEQLCLRRLGGQIVKPKIVASTATVRRAEAQIRALFDRDDTAIFPPPGTNRLDSFFAKTIPVTETNPGRLYMGVAAPGRGPKLVFLRSLTTALSAATTQWGSNPLLDPATINPADPYISALCYFNALRELGGARRIVEDEVKDRCSVYGDRRVRIFPPELPFTNRSVARIEELTSRVPTHEVSATRKRLGIAWGDNTDAVDVALATNMISVGLDITRLGLMLVQSQPKLSAEYIQATSRVGRDGRRPGLVLALLNLNRPRDRMHYEQFGAFHDTFYRTVEPTSVTPWSTRALDRALAPVVVSLARHIQAINTPNDQAARFEELDEYSASIVQMILQRAQGEPSPLTEQQIEEAVRQIFQDWQQIIEDRGSPVTLKYSHGPGGKQSLMHDPLHSNLGLNEFVRYRRFAAGRSMRDVEHAVPLDLRQPDGQKFKEDTKS